jgi:hypothetical protein
MMTNDARRVGRSRMGRFGFWVLEFLRCDPRIATFVLLATCDPALGFFLCQV